MPIIYILIIHKRSATARDYHRKARFKVSRWSSSVLFILYPLRATTKRNKIISLRLYAFHLFMCQYLPNVSVMYARYYISAVCYYTGMCVVCIIQPQSERKIREEISSPSPSYYLLSFSLHSPSHTHARSPSTTVRNFVRDGRFGSSSRLRVLCIRYPSSSSTTALSAGHAKRPERRKIKKNDNNDFCR